MPRKATATSLVSVSQLAPGMKVALDVLDTDGSTILIRANTLISLYTIRKLEKWQIAAISIVNETKTNPLANPKIQQFVHSYNKSVSVVQQAFETIRATQEVPVEPLQETASELSQSVLSTDNIISWLYDDSVLDDYTFKHSVNVATIATLIANWLNYPQSIVNSISLAGLLHDIGKALLPIEMLHHHHVLTEDEYALYKKHPALGFELIRQLADLSDSIKSAVFQHHEKIDGGGYPFGLTGGKIHPFAKIIAIADHYDKALTISRDPVATFSPYAGIELLDSNKPAFDLEICLMFNERMRNFLSGNIVALTDGRQGRVVYVDPLRPSRSIVQLTDGTILDLNLKPDLHIRNVIR